MLLPGVGEVLAERIVEGRPYQTVEDLRRVPGIGEKVFARLKESLQIAP
jgi:competence protein ComEA